MEFEDEVWFWGPEISSTLYSDSLRDSLKLKKIKIISLGFELKIKISEILEKVHFLQKKCKNWNSKFQLNIKSFK